MLVRSVSCLAFIIAHSFGLQGSSGKWSAGLTSTAAAAYDIRNLPAASLNGRVGGATRTQVAFAGQTGKTAKAPKSAQGAAQDPALGIKFMELDFRKTVLQAIRPVYSPDAIRSLVTGISVADVHVGVDGSVSSVDILTSPCDSIRTAMKEALSRWRFKILRSDEGVPEYYNGKITYYFVRQDDHGLVLDPTESFFVGPSFATTETRPVRSH